MTTHEQAREILERAVPGITPVESRLVRAISTLEAQYGDGWTGSGRGSNNWGAMTAGKSWKGRTFLHEDSRWNPKTRKQEKYTTRFRAYPTSEAGAADLYRALTTGVHAVAARLAREGKWSEISRAIGPRGTKYYMGSVPPPEAEDAHRKRFLHAIKTLAPNPFGNLSPWLLLAAIELLWGWSG